MRNLLAKVAGRLFVKPEPVDTPLDESFAGMHRITGHCPLADLVEVEGGWVRLNNIPNNCPGRDICQKDG